MIKKLLVALGILIATSTTTTAMAQQGDLSVGFKMGHAVEYETLTLGVDLRYHVLDNIRFAPSLTYMIRHFNRSAWYMDFEGHYVIDLTENFSFYPLGGPSLSVWNNHSEPESKNYTRLGLNIGLGGELRATDEISVNLDLKYNAIRNYHQALAALRVAYHF